MSDPIPNANMILVIFSLFVIFLAIWVELRARKNKNSDNDKFLSMLDWFETRGLGTFFHLLVFAGTALLTILGWRIPAEIGFYFGNLKQISNLLPIIEGDIIARSAQVIGALSLGFVGLRAMRFFIPIFIGLLTAVVVWGSLAYIFNESLPRIPI